MNITLTSQEEQLLNSVRGRISLDAYIKQSALMRAKKAQKKQNKVDDPQHQELEQAIQKVYSWFFGVWEKRFKNKYILNVDPKTKRCPDREKAIELIGMSDKDKATAMKWIVERFFQDDWMISRGCKLYLYSQNDYFDEAWSKKQQKMKKEKQRDQLSNPTRQVSTASCSKCGAENVNIQNHICPSISNKTLSLIASMG